MNLSQSQALALGSWISSPVLLKTLYPNCILALNAETLTRKSALLLLCFLIQLNPCPSGTKCLTFFAGSGSRCPAAQWVAQAVPCLVQEPPSLRPLDPHLSSAAAQPWLLHRPRPHELKEGKGLIHTPITQELQQLTWHF